MGIVTKYHSNIKTFQPKIQNNKYLNLVCVIDALLMTQTILNYYLFFAGKDAH